MAAVAKLHASKQPPYSIKSVVLYKDYPTTAVYNAVNVTTGAGATATTKTVNCKQVLPFSPNSSIIKRLVCCFHDFKQTSNKQLLDLQDLELHTKAQAREILGGELKSTWDSIVASATTASKTATADFPNNVRQFLLAYMPLNVFNIQRDYMVLASKPFTMSSYELASRFRLLNTLSVYLPGSSGSALYPDDTTMKNAFYCLMLLQWQLNCWFLGVDWSLTMLRTRLICRVCCG